MTRVHQSPPTEKEERQAVRKRESLRLAQRNKQALEMHLAGATFQQIADQLGWKTHSAASKAVQKALAAARPLAASETENYRAQEIARLERLHQSHWLRALQGDMRASDMILRISDRRARLLGLDQPVQVQAVVSTQLDQEIEGMLADMDRRERAALERGPVEVPDEAAAPD